MIIYIYIMVSDIMTGIRNENHHYDDGIRNETLSMMMIISDRSGIMSAFVSSLYDFLCSSLYDYLCSSLSIPCQQPGIYSIPHD